MLREKPVPTYLTKKQTTKQLMCLHHEVKLLQWRTCCSCCRLAHLEVPLREDQHEHGEANGAEQEALETPSAGDHNPPPGRTGEAVVWRLGRPALLQLVSDSPQTRREQMSHGARRESARAARRITGQE